LGLLFDLKLFNCFANDIPVWDDLIVDLGIVLHYVFAYFFFIFADDNMSNVIGLFIGEDECGVFFHVRDFWLVEYGILLSK